MPNPTKLLTGPFKINTWIVPLSENNVFIVDPAACKFTRDSSLITDYLKTNGLNPVAFILTHGHFDHIAGTRILKDTFPEVPLICHKEDLPMCGLNAMTVQGSLLEDMGLGSAAKLLENLPDADILISSEISLAETINSQDKKLKNAMNCWKFLHTPGHTPGSMCLYNENEKMLISGDTIFHYSYGRTDFPGGSDSQMANSLQRIYTQLPKDTIVYPGHNNYGFPLSDNF